MKKTKSTEEIIRCAIIGYGYMGEIRRNVIEKHQNLELKIICETDSEKLKGNNDFKVVRNCEKIFESDVDAVFICTPNYLIPELTVRCLENKKHVFCEKPPGRNLADILLMQETEKNNPGTKLMFGFNHRYHPGILKAKSIVDSGRMGKILTLRGLYGKSGGNNFANSWRNNLNVSGGGILLDQGIHMLDLFNYFIGGFIHTKAFLSNSHWRFDVEDNVMAIFKNKHEQIAMLHSSATFWKHMFQFNIILEKGYLKLEGLLSKTNSYGREKLTIGNRQFEDETEALGNPSEETIYFDKDLSWELEINRFTDFVIRNKPVSECGSNDAFAAMEMVHNCYQDSGFETYMGEGNNGKSNSKY